MSESFYFTPDQQVRVAQSKRILKACEHQSLVSAEQLLASAKQHAREIMEAAEEAYVLEKTRGYDEGLKLANEEKETAIYETLTVYAQAAQQLEGALAQVLPKVLKKMLGDADYTQVLGQYIKASVDELVHEQCLTIKVNPKHYEWAEHFVEQHLNNHAIVRVIRLERDETLALHQSLLETKDCIVVLDLQKQFDRLSQFAQQALSQSAESQVESVDES